MIFWHLGGATFLFRSIFRDPAVDFRFLWLGALLPDLVDIPTGRLLNPATSEAFAHALLAPVLAVTFVLVATRKQSRPRILGMTVVIGWLLHVLLDGVWTDVDLFLWPATGWTFPSTPALADFLSRALADPWRWVREAAGLFYLAVLGRRQHLSGDGWWRSLRAGRLS